MQTDPMSLYHCAALSHTSPRGFRREQQRFFKPVTPCACFGREKGVNDVTPEASADRSDFLASLFSKAISAPFARGNLHLVILYLVVE